MKQFARVTRFALLSWAALVVLSGCVGAPKPISLPPPPPAQQEPPTPRELPVTRLEEKTEAVRAPARLYTLSVQEADLREVMLTLAKKAGFNVIFGPEAKGGVSVDLQDATLEEAFESILFPLDLEIKQEGRLYKVLRPLPETRTMAVNYVAATRRATSAISATAGGGITGTAGASGTSSVTNTDLIDFWTDLEKDVKAIASPKAEVVVNKSSGFVTVRDFPRRLQKIAQYLEMLEGATQRQVLIQAHVIEVTLSDEAQVGIDWAAFPSQVLRLLSLKGNVVSGAANALATLNTAPVTTVFQLGVSQENFNILIRALSIQGSVNILSNPKISTLNNQKAVIKVGVDDIFFSTTTTTDPVTGRQTETITPQTITVGLVLDVTPQISSDGSIIMTVNPSMTDRVGTARSSKGDTVPIVSVRSASTVVKVRDGQTIIIGGLIQNTNTETRTGIPGLKDLPVAGGLFRRDERTGKKTELVILLIPTILTEPRIRGAVSEELDRLRTQPGFQR